MTALSAPDLAWRDARELGIEGRGWPDRDAPYRRLPERARGLVRPEVWERACSPCGLAVRFRSDSTTLAARWKLGCANPLNVRGAGLDCYGRAADGRWLWVGSGQPGSDTETLDRLNQAPLDGAFREYRLYFPLGTPLAELSVGVNRGARLEPGPLDARPPLVLYGTSIAQGAGVSRPGLCYPSILGRKLDYPVVNLGFSSHGTMDAEVAELIAELDAALYVIDCLPNLRPEDAAARAVRLVEILRGRRAVTPILFVGDRLFGDGAFIPCRREKQRQTSAAQRQAFESLLRRGVPGLHLLDERNFFGEDFEGSSDTVHANDIGALRMAEAVEPVVRRLLSL